MRLAGLLANPFTPSSIASGDHDFIGRERELRALTRGLDRGSFLIQGPMGIGKSSLLVRAIFLMQDLDEHSEVAVVSAVADREIHSADVLSRLLLEEIVDVDERARKVSFRLGPVQLESGAVYRNFQEGRHLAALKRLLHNDLMGAALSGKRFLVIAIDEADKCPVAMARLVRSVGTQLQAKGHENVRFLLAGASPFLQSMIGEDPGVERFFPTKISLAPLTRSEAGRLMGEKVRFLESYAAGEGIKLTIVAKVLQRILDMAGGTLTSCSFWAPISSRARMIVQTVSWTRRILSERSEESVMTSGAQYMRTSFTFLMSAAIFQRCAGSWR